MEATYQCLKQSRIGKMPWRYNGDRWQQDCRKMRFSAFKMFQEERDILLVPYTARLHKRKCGRELRHREAVPCGRASERNQLPRSFTALIQVCTDKMAVSLNFNAIFAYRAHVKPLYSTKRKMRYPTDHGYKLLEFLQA